MYVCVCMCVYVCVCVFARACVTCVCISVELCLDLFPWPVVSYALNRSLNVTINLRFLLCSLTPGSNPCAVTLTSERICSYPYTMLCMGEK